MSINNTEQQLIEGVLKHGPDILAHCVSDIDLSQYVDRVLNEKLRYPIPPTGIDHRDWFIPYEYEVMDIEAFLLGQCPKQNHDRLITEIELFKQHDMIPVLRTMKYVVDTLRSNKVVWGVGRGSSVASYVLHIIGVHKIDPIKYDIPIEEFFKEKQNG